jgi:hypothetical protein
MHVEFFNSATNHCYYAVQENGVDRVQVYHRGTQLPLKDFHPSKTVGEVCAEIRPMLDKLMAEVNNEQRWHIRFFDYIESVHSLTRSVRIVEELVTGDVCIVNGKLLDVKLHPIWAVNI